MRADLSEDARTLHSYEAKDGLFEPKFRTVRTKHQWERKGGNAWLGAWGYVVRMQRSSEGRFQHKEPSCGGRGDTDVAALGLPPSFNDQKASK